MIRAVVWTVAGLSAINPSPGVGYAPRLVQRPAAQVVAMQCAGECPTRTDQIESFAKLLNGIRASSTSTTQWMIGTSGPYTSAWVSG